VDVSVNCTGKGAWPEDGFALKLATTVGGGFVTVMVWLELLLWPGQVTVSVAVKLPALLYVWLGLCDELVAPSPKFQLQAVGPPVDVSVNCTVKGAWPELGLALKLAANGGGGFVTVIV